MTAEKIAQAMESNLAAFTGLGAKVAFDLGDDGAIAIDATGLPPAMSNEPDGAACTIRISAENLAKLIDGEFGGEPGQADRRRAQPDDGLYPGQAEDRRLHGGRDESRGPLGGVAGIRDQRSGIRYQIDRV
jgi:hypothetical protein